MVWQRQCLSGLKSAVRRLRVSVGTGVPLGMGEMCEEVDERAADLRQVWRFAEVKVGARFEGVADV